MSRQPIHVTAPAPSAAPFVSELQPKETLTVTDLIEVVWSGPVRAVVTSTLAPAGRRHEVDDVLASTAESVWMAAERFDPERGTPTAWVIAIARRRAIDHVRAACRAHRRQGELEVLAGIPGSAYAATSEDFSDEVLERMVGSSDARQVLALTGRLCRNPAAFTRFTVLVLTHGGDVAAAAGDLGITVDALRTSRREVTRVARVVSSALVARTDTGPVTVARLLACLPGEENETGRWVSTLTRIVVAAGGFNAVTPQSVATATGWSVNTTRQYIAEARWLLSVAYTVITDPHIS